MRGIQLLNPAECDQLEAVIDKHSLEAVLNALTDICGAKAEHIRSNYQDSVTARPWEAMGGRLNREAEESNHYGI